MARIAYIEKSFRDASLEVIWQANTIISEYQAIGFSLTLRQLYYQFIARGLLQNSQKNYNRLGLIVNEARLAGLIDWDAIEDRTRNLRGLAHWRSADEIVEAAARSFRHDRWQDQTHRVEVWIEKDALLGVIEGVCNQYDVPFFSCRGYTSQSEMHAAAMRLQSYRSEAGQEPIILHFGDHDPSGMDMTRDIADRMSMFIGGVEVRRLALNMDQVEQYDPPPNPAKITDSRAAGYIDRFGAESWELDALDPRNLAALIRGEIENVLDSKAWKASLERQEYERQNLTETSSRWRDVVTFVQTKDFAEVSDMPRCPSCCTFVSLETEAQAQDVTVQDDGSVTAEIRLVRMCGSCGSEELKETSLTLEGQLETEAECSEDEHLWALDDDGGEPEVTERSQTHDRNGKPIKNSRYRRSYIGASLTVEGKCSHCGTTASVTLEDETTAGSFDELT